MNKEQELRNSLAGANLILKKAIKDVEREYKALEGLVNLSLRCGCLKPELGLTLWVLMGR